MAHSYWEQHAEGYDHHVTRSPEPMPPEEARVSLVTVKTKDVGNIPNFAKP